MRRLCRGLAALLICVLPHGAAVASDAVAPPAMAAGFEAVSPEVAAALEAKAAGRPVESRSWMVPAGPGTAGPVAECGGNARAGPERDRRAGLHEEFEAASLARGAMVAGRFGEAPDGRTIEWAAATPGSASKSDGTGSWRA